MDTATRRRIRARRVANFHERLSQRRQIAPDLVLNRPADPLTVEQREAIRERVAANRRRLEDQREVAERLHRNLEAEANREAHENLHRLRREEEETWELQLRRAEDMERDADRGNVDLSDVRGLGDAIVSNYREDQITRLRRRATNLRRLVAREREQRRTSDLRAGEPTVLGAESDTESIPSVQDLSEVPDPSDVPNLSDVASSSSSSEGSSDFEALIRANSQANESQPAVRDVVVRIERFSFSNERLNRTAEGNAQENDVLQRFTAERRRSERIRRNTTRAQIETARATQRERRAAYRPQQPTVPQVRRMINESSNQPRTSSFQVVSASSLLSSNQSPEQQRPTPRVGTGGRSSSRPLTRDTSWLPLRIGNRPERQPETARRARLQATRDARVQRAEQRTTGDEPERNRPQSFLQYRAWLDAVYERTRPNVLNLLDNPSERSQNREEEPNTVANVRQLQFWSDLVQFDLLNMGNRQAGLTKAQVDRLPRRKFRQTRSTMHESCHICLCDFENGQELYRLTTCKHDFHTACLQPWVEKHKTCPVCRQDISVPSSNSRSQARPEATGVVQPFV